MQIVINILKETYQDIVENGFIYDEDGEEISHAIINGTPLDDLRAEIEQKIVRRSGLSHTRSERDRNDAFLEVLDIIDKYKTESESKD